ncbi:GNAT family N-acetyltransferase [Pseudaestuariivita sp.]|uniref:GNAT family N-acetyltransferase n=1 Tax=Pseudaestuariivita sp. TaxID=2211669 RepID=UPI0040597842
MHTISALDLPADRADLDALMRAYFADVLPRIAALGAPAPTVAQAVAGAWDDIDKFLPPNGQVFIARGTDGQAVGCGFLHQCAPGAGEMKRLYVAPSERGTGLGRKLVEARIDAARGLGWHSVYADTFKGNTGMLKLYDRLGFAPCDLYDGNANYPEILPVCVFRKLAL